MSAKVKVRRKGSVIIFVVVVLACLLGIMALAVDVGYLYNVKRDLQSAVDAAALAGAGGLSTDQDTAHNRAIEYAMKNRADNVGVVLESSDVQLGLWDQATGFEPIDSPAARPNAVKVTGHLTDDRGTAVKLFLANIFGVSSADVSTSAIAVFGSRDIMLVLDYSGSMSYDSQLQHIDILGRAEVESYLTQIWNELHGPADSPLRSLDGTNMTLASVSITSGDVMNQLALNSIPYPYPPKNWNDYFSYVQNLATPYKNVYGYLTFMDFLQQEQSTFAVHHVPLWQTPEQPVTAVKDAVTVFLAYMNEERTDDRLGLASYTYTNGGGKLEVALTDDYGLIEARSRQMQAGHYQRMTNIAGGMQAALTELRTRGRPGALRMMALLSDGNANLYNNVNNPPRARNAALEQARLAAADGISILTISLGAEADTDLMQEIADITGGIHFIVPGGNDVADYEEQLFEVFARIAAHRPLRLVD